MMPVLAREEINRLSAPERLAVIGALWDIANRSLVETHGPDVVLSWPERAA
jgi:hypothetical protein